MYIPKVIATKRKKRPDFRQIFKIKADSLCDCFHVKIAFHRPRPTDVLGFSVRIALH